MRINVLIRLLLVLSIAAPASRGQSSTSTAGSRNSGSSAASDKNGEQSAPGSLGFSIESEMLTYKSLQANTEAIACDIARYLYGSEVGPASQNAPCTIQSGSNVNLGVVIVSPGGSVFADFQAWQADMATMNALELRASRFCTTDARSRGGPAARGGPSPLSTTIPGQMAPLVESTVGLFASNQSVSPVTGTVQDQALMNGVARQLKTLRISVLIPEIYSPYSMGGMDYSSSPFLWNLSRLVDARDACFQVSKNAPAQPQQAQNDEVDNTIKSIDAFMAIALGVTPLPSDTAGTASGHTADTASAKSSATSTGSTAHLISVLAADRLARAIGVKADGSAGPDPKWQHILWLKALESGGSILKKGNIFGTKIRYSGGAVATYALFALDGNLDCSGNVYDFEGSVRPQDFSTSFRKPVADPTEQLIFVRGSCSQPK